MCCQVFPIVYLLTRARGQGRPCARYQRFSNKNTSRVVQKCQRNRLKNHFHPCHVLHKGLYLPKVHSPFTHFECFMCFNHNVPSTMENMRYRTLILSYFSGLWLRWCIVLVHASCVNYDTSEGSPLWENFATRLLRLQAIRHGWPVATLNWFQADFLWNFVYATSRCTGRYKDFVLCFVSVWRLWRRTFLFVWWGTAGGGNSGLVALSHPWPFSPPLALSNFSFQWFLSPIVVEIENCTFEMEGNQMFVKGNQGAC